MFLPFQVRIGYKRACVKHDYTLNPLIFPPRSTKRKLQLEKAVSKGKCALLLPGTPATMRADWTTASGWLWVTNSEVGMLRANHHGRGRQQIAEWISGRWYWMMNSSGILPVSALPCRFCVQCGQPRCQ